jgi:antitoxin ParD1/3/4
MSKVVKRTFSLTEEQAAFIDAKVESGGYVSGSEVVREGLRGLQEDEAAMERWIREEVVPAIEELEADPELARPAQEVFDEILKDLGAPEQKARKSA